MTGLPKVGWPASLAATTGLSLLRRGRGWQGVALLAATAALIWVRREEDDTTPPGPS